MRATVSARSVRKGRTPPRRGKLSFLDERRSVIRAVVYARVSTTKRSQSTSVRRQLAELAELARRRGWPVVGKYFDRLSGGSADRPGLMLAVEAVIQGRAEMLMVDALDRLGRNVRHLLETVDAVEEAGGNLFVRDLNIDTSTPSGRLTLTTLATLAEYQRRENVRKVIAGIEHARKKGVRLGRPPKITPAALELAVSLRRRRPRPSWRVITAKIAAAKLGRFKRTSIASAVTACRKSPSKTAIKKLGKTRVRTLARRGVG